MYLSVFDTLLLLRWLGTFALLFTIFNRVVSYSSPNVSMLSFPCLSLCPPLSLICTLYSFSELCHSTTSC